MAKIKYCPIYALPKQEDRIDKLKVHNNQADHEIIELLLDTYDKYTRAVDDDVS